MTEHYADDMVTLLHGDALAEARLLTSGSVQTIVTSPPYFGLRDYGTDGQMGAEETVEGYVVGMVALFSELRRVLADDGTLWLNLGDSYATRWGSVRSRSKLSPFDTDRSRRPLPGGTVAKNLLGIPWRVAFALQDDGWFVRSEVIWHKPNAMPESAVDRPSRDHETIFLLSKAANYYYDASAVRQVYTGDRAPSRRARTGNTTKENSLKGAYVPDDDSGRNRRTVWTVPLAPFAGAHFAVYPPELIRPCILAGSRPGDTVLDPFSGSGTTGMVATEEGRKYIGIDLNSDYLDLSLRTRFAQPVLNFGASA